MPLTPDLRVKRAYDPLSPDDGCRILVDRLWPRGLAKATAGVDLWLRDIAPSTELRRWFGHQPARWAAFQVRYAAELAANPGPLSTLRERLAESPVTLLYAARDTEHNHALALRDWLLDQRFKGDGNA